MSRFTTTTMPPHPSPPLTIIVAATHRTFGIGRASALPWPPLRTEMGYFARVTRGAPPQHINAVIMGRKTWESIPKKFAPLRGRMNIVVSRRPEMLGMRPFDEVGQVGKGQEEGPFAVGSVEEALGLVGRLWTGRDGWSASTGTATGTPAETRPSLEASQALDCAPPASGKAVSRIFFIGGAEIYATALRLPSCERVLLSRIYTDFDCDTFFAVKLNGERSAHKDGEGREGVWVKRSKAELDAWVGQDVPAGRVKEAGVEWDFEMWERENKETNA